MPLVYGGLNTRLWSSKNGKGCCGGHTSNTHVHPSTDRDASSRTGAHPSTGPASPGTSKLPLPLLSSAHSSFPSPNGGALTPGGTNRAPTGTAWVSNNGTNNIVATAIELSRQQLVIPANVNADEHAIVGIH
jgi:hypothetical protein